MSFVARNVITGELVDISQECNAKAIYSPEDFVCPYCETIVYIRSSHLRRGTFIQNHFYHSTPCTYEHHLESREHHIGKLALAKKLSDEMRDFADIKIEYSVEMEWRDKGRIIDIAAVFHSGYVEAHEIQLSSITIDELKERTNDYARKGITTCWYLGKKNRTNIDLIEAATELCDNVGFIEFYEDQSPYLSRDSQIFLSKNSFEDV